MQLSNQERSRDEIVSLIDERELEDSDILEIESSIKPTNPLEQLAYIFITTCSIILFIWFRMDTFMPPKPDPIEPEPTNFQTQLNEVNQLLQSLKEERRKQKADQDEFQQKLSGEISTMQNIISGLSAKLDQQFIQIPKDGSQSSFRRDTSEIKPLYVHLVGVEGSGHHGLHPIAMEYAKQNNYKLLDSKGGCKGNDDKWVNDMLEDFRIQSSKERQVMFLRDASFPCGTSGWRSRLEDSVDFADPIGSITTILTELQLYQHPTSLLKHWALSRNMISHSYDFKVLWLQRDIIHSIYSRSTDWKLDGDLQTHAVIIAAFELYIAWELSLIYALDPSACQRIWVEELHTNEGQVQTLDALHALIPPNGTESCTGCFKKWRQSKKNAEEDLNAIDFKYLKKISDFVAETKDRITSCS